LRVGNRPDPPANLKANPRLTQAAPEAPVTGTVTGSGKIDDVHDPGTLLDP
jgi:hypothetical protein